MDSGMDKKKPRLKGSIILSLISPEDQQAIYRLTEQAETLLKTAKSFPKAQAQVKRAEQICEDISRIIHTTNDITIRDFFEVTIAPRLVRLAQELKLKRQFKQSRTRPMPATKQNETIPRSTTVNKASIAKPVMQESTAQVIRTMLRDLSEMLK